MLKRSYISSDAFAVALLDSLLGLADALKKPSADARQALVSLAGPPRQGAPARDSVRHTA